MHCCTCNPTEHKTIDCPLSWYICPLLSAQNSSPRDENVEDTENTESPAAASQPAVPVDPIPADDDGLGDGSPSVADYPSSSAPVESVSMNDGTDGVAPPSSAPPGVLDTQGFILPQLDLGTLTVHPITVLPSASDDPILEDLQQGQAK